MGFNKGIVSTTNNDLWIFETDFENCAGAGIEIAAGAASGGSFKISECDFIQCAKGINLLSGVSETISIINCTFYNTTSGTDIGILYTPATFTSFVSMFITNNAWNNQGTFVSGFDFTRSDGRDANAFLINNAGMENENPHCKINVVNNALTTTVTTAGTYYKANWTNTIFLYKPSGPWQITESPINLIMKGCMGHHNRKYFVIPSLISVLTIAIIRNGITGTRYGETDLRITSCKPAISVFNCDLYPEYGKE